MKLCAITLVALLLPVTSALAASWQRPVRGPVLRAFELSADRYARGQHRGLDLGAPPGTTVRAACAGRVRFAGSVPGGGRTVSVRCGGLVATYQHLGATAVRRGRLVLAGAAVGTVGRSGRPRERRAHVHLGAREAASGRYVDPGALFGGAPGGSPPVGRAPRRPAPLGPAPLGPAPRPALPRPALLTAPLAADPVAVPAPRAALVVWAGLAMFGLGLPLGGLLHRRRRRPSRPAAAVRGRGWASAHR